MRLPRITGRIAACLHGILLTFLLTGVTACRSPHSHGSSGDRYLRPGTSLVRESVLRDFAESVPSFMNRYHVPGSAFALVDEEGLLWAQGFGSTASRHGNPATPDTTFRVMSVTKVFTAAAVLLAVQDGLLELDAPITRYVPNLHFNSAFQNQPERVITLRHLLSHTSGLPFEAPRGNSFEPTGTLQESVESLRGVWLRYPVGGGCHYSNAGLDLAALILQAVSEVPFKEFVAQRILAPLEMSRSRIAYGGAVPPAAEAVGHTQGIKHSVHPGPMLGAAGLVSSARDLARFVHLQLRGDLLQPSSRQEMLTPIGYRTGDQRYVTHFGLGIQVDIGRDRTTLPRLRARHGGAGAGYTSFICWLPEYGVGGVAVANRYPVHRLEDFTLDLMNRLITEARYPRRSMSIDPDELPRKETRESEPAFRPTPFDAEWKPLRGTYRMTLSGYELKWYARLAMQLGISAARPSIRVHKVDGCLCLSESRFLGRVLGERLIKEPLRQTQPGVFMTQRGDCLDFTRPEPRYNNYRVHRR